MQAPTDADRTSVDSGEYDMVRDADEDKDIFRTKVHRSFILVFLYCTAPNRVYRNDRVVGQLLSFLVGLLQNIFSKKDIPTCMKLILLGRFLYLQPYFSDSDFPRTMC